MTLPQDTRAPHRQQRWVECENVGGEEIPAFGVVEIVESTRPENGDESLTPGGGRTVVQVRRPTGDSLCNVLVNGHLPIAAGEYGFCTHDYPHYARYDGSNPTVDTEWGTVKNSFALGQGRQGFLIMGDANAADGTVRVTRNDKLLRVNLYETLEPGGSAQAYVQHWNGSTWNDTATIITVTDPYYRAFGLSGEKLWVECYGDQHEVVCEVGLRRKGKAVTEIEAGTAGLVEFWHSPLAPDCVGSASGYTTLACHDVQAVNLSMDDTVFVHYHTEYRKWMILTTKGRGLIRFKMKSKLPLGGKGTAIEIGTGTTYTEIGSEFPIKDPWNNPGMWRDDTSADEYRYKGWCVIPDSPEFYTEGVPFREIVWMEQIARSINFSITPTSEMSGGQANATVDKYYTQGKNPEETDLWLFSTHLLVHDPQTLFAQAKKNAKGMARYNERDHRYEVIACDQQCPIQIGTLSTKMCPADSGIVPSTDAMWYPPYGQDADPVVQSITNPLGLAGIAGDKVVATWNGGAWIALQVQHHQKLIVTDVNYDSDNCRLVMPSLTSAVMYCDTQDQYLVLTRQYFVTDINLADTTGTGSSHEGSCKLNYDYGYVCGFGATVAEGTNLAMDFLPYGVLADVYEDGNWIKGSLYTLYTPCVDGPWVRNLIELTDCPTGSST